MPKELVIIPAFNEELNIKKIIEEINIERPGCDCIVVNDGSTDRTEEIVMEMRINIVSHPVNLGAGAAVQTGLKYADRNKYEIAVVIDGDGQHDPKEVSRIIDAMAENNADVVIGSRFLDVKSNIKVFWARRVGINIFSFIATLVGRCKITDCTSGYRAFNQNAIYFMVREIPIDFPDADIILLLLLAGFRITEVPVSTRRRQHGQSMFTLIKSIYYPFKMILAINIVMLRSYFLKRR